MAGMDFSNDDVLRGVFITYLTIYHFGLQGNGAGSKCRLLPHATETKSWKLGIRQWCYQGRISTLRCSMRWGQGCWIYCFNNTGGSVRLNLAQWLLFIKCVNVQLSAELTIGRT